MIYLILIQFYAEILVEISKPLFKKYERHYTQLRVKFVPSLQGVRILKFSLFEFLIPGTRRLLKMPIKWFQKMYIKPWMVKPVLLPIKVLKMLAKIFVLVPV